MKFHKAIIYYTLSVFAVLSAYFIHGTASSGGFTAITTLRYYLILAGMPLVDGLAAGFLIYVTLFLVYSLISVVRRGSQGTEGDETFFLKYLGQRIFRLAREFAGVAAICVPVILSSFFLSIVLSYVNHLARADLKDLWFMKADLTLTGGLPFVALASFHYPGWFVEVLWAAFLGISFLVIFAAMYIFHINRKLCVEFAACFSLALIIMLAPWRYLPALSPQDRFIDNVYNLPVPSSLALLIDNYHPQAEIVSFLKEERAMKQPLKDMPTTTMPSAHIAWITITGYYLYRARRLAALVGATPLALSALGTVFFAQHYFVDILGGIVAAAIAVAIVRLLDRLGKYHVAQAQA